MKHRAGWIVVMAALVACGNKDEKASTDHAAPAGPVEPAKPEPPKPEPPKPEPPPEPRPAKPAKGQATVEMTLTGAVEKKLSGSIGMCQIPIIGGKPVGASYQVHDGDIQLTILATSEKEIQEPKLVLNISGASSASYALRKKATLAKLEPGKSAEVEADLVRIGKKDTVHVKGTVTCNPE